MPLPVVYFHTGMQSYLAESLAQTRQSSPSCPIWLLGDASNRAAEGVRHVDFANYWRRAQTFEPAYVHLSTNSHVFELRCIQRWFAILELAESEGWTEFVYLDSDVLVFTDLEELSATFGDAELTLHGRSPTPHVVFVRDVRALRRFVDFIEQTYRDPARLAPLREMYEKGFVEAGQPGGVCDMTLWNRFREAGLARTFDTSAIVSGATIDNNMNAAEGYRMAHGLKRIVWRDGLPHGVREDGAEVRFHVMHFQGPAKGYVRFFRRRRPLSAWAAGMHRLAYRLERGRARLRLG